MYINVGWLAWRLVGDNESALSQIASLRARADLKRPNRHLRRLFYLLRQLCGTIYLEFVPGDLNLANCCWGIDSSGAAHLSKPVPAPKTVSGRRMRVTANPHRFGCWGFPKAGRAPVRTLCVLIWGRPMANRL